MSFKEFEFIDTLPEHPDVMDLMIGRGDDAAAIVHNGPMCISSDAMAEGMHFLGSDEPYLIGRKLATANLSDMAAMGCKPRFFIWNLHVGKKWQDEEVLRELQKGLNEGLAEFDAILIGGDTIRTKGDDLQMSGMIMGTPYGAAPITRSGARAGNTLAVTGSLGGSYPHRHLRFEPRCQWSEWICTHLSPSSMLDISDGLLQDLGHLLDRSEVSAELDLFRVPIHPDLQEDTKAIDHALADGEDFELLFTFSGDEGVELPGWITPIGQIVEGDGEILSRKKKGSQLKSMKRRGYCHDAPS